MAIPMFHEGELVGVITIGRTEVRPFGPAEVRIGEAFAQQAAIAIANAKLFNDLDAALKRQTAMTDVLDAVSTARYDPQRVFDRIAGHAAALTPNTMALLSLVDGDETVIVAFDGPEEVKAMVRAARQRAPIDHGSPSGACILNGELVRVSNWDDVPTTMFPTSRSRAMGMKSSTIMPMKRNNRVVGVLNFDSLTPGKHPDADISLLRTFANQAAIAVDNARLLREIEDRRVCNYNGVTPSP